MSRARMVAGLSMLACIACGGEAGTQRPPQPARQASSPPHADVTAVATAPSPPVCAVLAVYAGGFAYQLGCPPVPEPVSVPRPCAMQRRSERVRLRYDEAGRLVDAGGAPLRYDADGQLVEIDRTPALFEERTLVWTVEERGPEGVVIRVGDEVMWRFELSGALVQRIRVERVALDPGDAPVSEWTFSREPGLVSARDSVSGEHIAITYDRQGRIVRALHTPADDPSIEDEFEPQPSEQRFTWSEDRLTVFQDGSEVIPIEYDCSDP
jgi:hypothetical protein